jgi:uncharacterized cupin superfamily protein
VQLAEIETRIDRWDAAPIPASWVREGEPVARAAVLSRCGDGNGVICVWECSAGRFDWTYDIDEMILLLEGEVLITHADGTRSQLTAGSSFFFPTGSRFQWMVPNHVRKLAYLHSPRRHPVRRALGAVKRLLTGRGVRNGHSLAGDGISASEGISAGNGISS